MAGKRGPGFLTGNALRKARATRPLPVMSYTECLGTKLTEKSPTRSGISCLSARNRLFLSELDIDINMKQLKIKNS
ncbi:MAG: hypothetical protein CSA20_02090 [Deltaproteobacteria bacterium]|nr:MAG: hypothetical protein CSA20_02090 [Deltaproteobacteria bacterium]